MTAQPVMTAAPSGARFKVLGLLFSMSVIMYFDRLCISAAAPTISTEFHLSPSQMGYVFSAFTLAYAVFEVPSGWLGDYIGTRKALARIVLWWSIFTALTGVTGGFASLIVIRFLFGAGEAGAVPNTTRTISRWFPASQQGRAISVSFIGLATGAAISTPVVFWLIRHQGWRWPFFEFGLIGAVWCCVWYKWFRDTPEQHGSVNTHEINVIRRGETDLEQFGHTRHVPWATILTSPNLLLICAMYFGYGYALYFYITWLPTYLLKGRGFSENYAGLFSAMPWVLGIGAFWFGGWVTDWLSNRSGSLKVGRCVVGAIGLLGSAMMLIAVARTGDRILAAVFLSLALVCQLMTGSVAFAVCLDVGRRNAGVISGVMNMVGNLGGTIAPVVVGYVLDKWGSWTIPFYVTAILLGVSVVMWLLIDPYRSVIGDAPVVLAADL
jgi:ACS family glucarate transporter-like MFS transporter